jgi:hypothetical protein
MMLTSNIKELASAILTLLVRSIFQVRLQQTLTKPVHSKPQLLPLLLYLPLHANAPINRQRASMRASTALWVREITVCTCRRSHLHLCQRRHVDQH